MDLTFSWRRVLHVLVAIGTILALYHGPGLIQKASQRPLRAVAEQPSSGLAGFEKDHEFDALTTQQCSDIFPELFHEVDRAVKFWKKKGHTISAKDVEVAWRKWDGTVMGNGSGGAMRILIHDNELRILQSEGTIGHLGYRGRGMGFLFLLQRAIDSAIAAGEMLPTIEAALIVEDIVDFPNGTDDTHSFWTWTSHDGDATHARHWMIPNYDLWYGYPMGSFREARRRAVKKDAPFVDKIPKAVWRGSGFLNPKIRNKLVDSSKGKKWSDISIADWGGLDSDQYLSVEDMCEYAITVHTEGVSYSGRLSYLTNCNSLLIFHKHEWQTFTTHLLKHEGPDQNYVRVDREWEELPSNVEYYLRHPEEAEKIIANSLDTFRNRYLTRPAISCYIRRLIQGYSTVSFKPKVLRPSKKGGKNHYRRGISFEKFLDGPKDADFESDKWF